MWEDRSSTSSTQTGSDLGSRVSPFLAVTSSKGREGGGVTPSSRARLFTDSLSPSPSQPKNPSIRSLTRPARPRTPIPAQLLSPSARARSTPPLHLDDDTAAQRPPHWTNESETAARDPPLATTDPLWSSPRLLAHKRDSLTSSVSTTSSSSYSLRRISPLSTTTTSSAPELGAADRPRRARDRLLAAGGGGAVEREIDLFIHSLNPARVHPWSQSPKSGALPELELEGETSRALAEGANVFERGKKAEKSKSLPGWNVYTNVETGAQLWVKERVGGSTNAGAGGEMMPQSRWSDSTVGGPERGEDGDDGADSDTVKDGGTLQSRRARRYLSIQPPPPLAPSRRSLIGLGRRREDLRTPESPLFPSPPPAPVLTEFPPYYTKLPLPPLPTAIPEEPPNPPPSASASTSASTSRSTSTITPNPNASDPRDSSEPHSYLTLDLPLPLPRATQLWNQITPSSPTYLTRDEHDTPAEEGLIGSQLMMSEKRRNDHKKRIARLITHKERLALSTKQEQDAAEEELETLKSERELELEHERWYNTLNSRSTTSSSSSFI